jgi:hypothetical protein
MIRVNGAAVEHMSEDELSELHARLAFGIMQTGLVGHPLDEAIAAAFGRVVQIIERERAVGDRRRSNIQVVKT